VTSRPGALSLRARCGVAIAGSAPRRTARGTPAGLLAGLAAVAVLLAGCESGGEDPPATSTTGATGTAAASPPPLAAAECVSLEHEGQRLGVTMPAGFSVATPPSNAAELADTQHVNLLSLAQRPESGRALPTAMIAVYGYGRGEAEGQRALELSVLNLKLLSGGSSRTNPITATPATVAGTQGSAGGDVDARALDFTGQDALDSPLRWWTVPTDDGLFVVTLATSTPDLDRQYAAELLSGLKPGGC
jgi:hypothetical protein